MLTANGNNKPLPVFDLSAPLVEIEAWPPPKPEPIHGNPTCERKVSEPKPVPTAAMCHKCKNTLPIADFITAKGSVKNRCKACRKAVRRKQTNAQRKTRLPTREVKEMLLTQIGQESCSRCGYNEFISALEFHHRNPKQKDSRVSSLVSRYATTPTEANMDRLTSEASKCVILCSNCHQALHAKDW